MKCSKCGFENETHANFCKKCGNKLNVTNPNDNNGEDKGNNKFIYLLTFLVCLILIMAAIGLSNSNTNQSTANTNIPNEVLDTYLTIEPNEPLDGSDAIITGKALKIQLKDSNGNGVAGETIYITVQDFHSWDNYTYECELDNNGLGLVTLNIPAGDYEVTADFVGNSHYHAYTQTIELFVLEGFQEITQSDEPLVEGVDYDFSKLTPEQWEKVRNNPGGHISGGHFYAQGEGQ